MKETIEEAVKTYYEENIDQSNIPREHYEWEIQDLMLGFAYKWQQEQDKKMYSEEDILNALHSVELKDNKNYSKIYNGMKEYLKQFKKK